MRIVRLIAVATLAGGLLGFDALGSRAEAALIQINSGEINGVFPGNDCGGQGGFSNCFATQLGTQQGANEDPLAFASPTVYKLNSSNNQPTGPEEFSTNYTTVDGDEFTITYNQTNNTLQFTYTPNDLDDPALHYVTVKQSNGFVLFYDADPVTSGSFALNSYFPNNPGWSHITFFNSEGGTPPTGVPEPGTLGLLGAALLGLGLVRRARRKA